MPSPENPISQRLQAVIDHFESGVQRQFALQVGVAPGRISEIFGERQSKPSAELLQKTAKAYPLLRIEWLLLGEGPMLKSEKAAPSPVEEAAATNKVVPLTQQQHIEEPRLVVPDQAANKAAIIFNVKAAANYLSGYDSQEPVEQVDVLTMPRFMLKGQHHAVFPVIGDSMEPTFLAKDYVVCRFVPPQDWASIKDFDVCVIVSKTHGVQLKRLKVRPAEHLIRCLSDNRRHRRFNLDFSEVVEIWRFEWRITASAENITEDLFKKVDALEDNVEDLRGALESIMSSANILRVSAGSKDE
ncbi:hypothetical protein LJ737_04430 [Hymenobacter sp. 15J16-1T3B]|uniref:XRE family transcriptional regulator n=1 Tax=Hymenobacter sp. 15J16-1T3B TaxID=2886941 RepID=UPI001D122020|nr:S24 family peptidase [Hymenobacter sp. 15J16-1T3B]MCC3156470.1 hypothetical protein [Hymenobacter sp. 15J16-1T3B]